MDQFHKATGVLHSAQCGFELLVQPLSFKVGQPNSLDNSL
jgi:hypothetical protein